MFKKYKLLRVYIKTLKEHITEIRNHFIENPQNFTYKIIDLDYDRAYRIYTVLNLTPNTTENIQKYGYRYLDNESEKFISDLNKQLTKYGLMELVGLSRVDQISNSSIHIVVEFSLLKTTKLYRNIIITSLLSIIGIISSLIIFL